MSITADRTYTTVDKSGWGDGPWQDEPDKLQWVDEATGLDCLIVRNSLGALCGYVGVGPDHPWHGRDYSTGTPGNNDLGDGDGYYADDCPAEVLDAHGGITYADACQEGEDESKGVCHVPLPGRSGDVWWFGFDCAHSGDVVPEMEAREREQGWAPIRMGWEAYRTVPYVQRECAKLAEQLAAVSRTGVFEESAGSTEG